MPCDVSVIQVSLTILPLQNETGKEDSSDLPLAGVKYMRLKVKKISNNGSEAPVILVLMKVLLLCTFSGLYPLKFVLWMG